LLSRVEPVENAGVRQALLAGWIAFAYLVGGASPAHFWLDSGELGAAAIDLGVMHPPGAPGLGLLLRAASVIPVGTLGFRMSVACSAFGALAVMGVFAILRRRGADGWVAWGAALWLLAGWTFVRQARVVEVYAFAAVLLVFVLWGFDPALRSRAAGGPRSGRCTPTARRLLAVFAATWGAWCFGDLRLAFAVPVAILWALAFRRGRAWARWAPLVVVAATAIVLTIPLASARGPMTDWGNAETASALWDHLQARSIREAYAPEILPRSAALWWHNLAGVLDRLAQDLGPAGPALTLVALVVLWARRPAKGRRRDHRVAAGASWLLFVFMFYAVGINPMGGEDRQTGLPVAVVAALVVGEALRRVLVRMPRLRWALPPLLWTVLVLPAGLLGFGDHVTTRSWAPHAWTRLALEQLPPGTLLLTQSDDLAAGVLAAKIVEGARPDVTVIAAQHLHKPMPRTALGTAAEPVWRAAARGSTEPERIGLAMQAHGEPLALEHPASGLFVPIPWWPETGRLPLGVAGVGASPRRSIADEVEAWLDRLPSREDRRRLGIAIASWARGVARARGAIAAAGAAIELSLDRVDPEHASALVTLAALRDRVGDTQGAIVLTRRALELEPDRMVALSNLALYLGRDPATRAEAIELAERAVALRPWRADAWDGLARLRAAAGDVEGAANARRSAEAAAGGVELQ
jgi:hypothetical protein